MRDKRFEQRKAVGGRLVQAWDTVFQRTVAIKQLPDGISAHGNGAQLTAAWERWYAAPHPGLLKPVRLDFEEQRLVREWLNGFSLLDLLRRRRRLEAEEAAALLESAAPTLDHAACHGLLGEVAMDKWFAGFQSEGGNDMPAFSEPLAKWPAWQVRLDPLRFASLIAGIEDCTRQFQWDQHPDLSPAVGTALGLARELLGGSVQRIDAPLSALNDEGNRVLLAARTPGEFASATELAAALLATIHPRLPPAPPRPARPVREYDLIDPRGAPCQPGEKLQLEPASPRSRPLQLVHRDELRLGRSNTEADLVLRFAEQSQGGEDFTKALSRVHARLRRQGEELRLLDGSATGPSRNGTFTREGPLTDPAGLPLDRLALVQLGGHWRATLAPTPAPRETVWFREEQTQPRAVESEPPAGSSWGAVFIMPAHDCQVRVETVWLLEEAGFGVDPDGTLLWDWEGLGAAPAAFRIYDGAFFVLNRRLEGVELSVNLRPVKPGSACLLRDGLLIAAGRDSWRIRIA